MFHFCHALKLSPASFWWVLMDSNHRPLRYQHSALTNWAKDPIGLHQFLVEDDGIEPTTPCLQSRCSPSWANPPGSSCIGIGILVGLVGLEPTTPALSTQCSNQLSYRPIPCSPLSLSRPPGLFQQPISVDVQFEAAFFQKGGDPAAPSDTATLLRLHPSHEPRRGKRPPCG